MRAKGTNYNGSKLQRQQKRRQTKGLMGGTMALHARTVINLCNLFADLCKTNKFITGAFNLLIIGIKRRFMTKLAVARF